MTVSYRDDLGDILPNTINDAIVADPCLTNVLATDLGNNTTNERELLKLCSRSEDPVLPVPCRIPIATFLRDVSDNGGAAKAAAL